MPYRRIRKTNEQKAKPRRRRQKKKESPNMAFYNSSAWRQLRKNYIMNHPICKICNDNGILQEGHHVDHIQPISQGGARLDPNNLQTLCITCHSRKTIKEQQ